MPITGVIFLGIKRLGLDNCKIKIAVVGTLLLDGQRTIWIEQWKQMALAHQNIFELYYFCFA